VSVWFQHRCSSPVGWISPKAAQIPRCPSVGHREMRERGPSVLEIAQEHEPPLLTLALTALAGQHDFFSRGERTHDREERALAVRDARLPIEAVGPPVDDRQIRQIPLRPGFVLEFEPCVESLNRARRRRALTQQAAQRHVEIPGGQPVQEQLRKQRADFLGPPRDQREDLALKAFRGLSDASP
jgi:hypothetical protein